MKTRTDLVLLLGILALIFAAGVGCGDDPQSADDDAGLADASGSDVGGEDAGPDVGDQDTGRDDAGGGDADGEPVGYEEMWQALDGAHGCSNGYCHGGNSAPAIIGYGALVDQASECDDSVLVVPGDPEQSLLWRKIAPGIAAEDVCGDKMAPNDPVDQELADQVYEWIADGAQR